MSAIFDFVGPDPAPSTTSYGGTSTRGTSTEYPLGLNEGRAADPADPDKLACERYLPTARLESMALELADRTLLRWLLAANLKRGDEMPVPQNSAEREEPTRTDTELATIARVSHDTINKIDRLKQTAAPEAPPPYGSFQKPCQYG